MFGVTVDLASSSSLSLSIFTPNHNLFFSLSVWLVNCTYSLYYFVLTGHAGSA